MGGFEYAVRLLASDFLVPYNVSITERSGLRMVKNILAIDG